MQDKSKDTNGREGAQAESRPWAAQLASATVALTLADVARLRPLTKWERQKLVASYKDGKTLEMVLAMSVVRARQGSAA